MNISILRSRLMRYASVGVVNTAVHWATFGGLVGAASCSQATSNLVAFLVAVTVSFVLNARFTFRKQASGARYFLFMPFMAMLSYLVGWLGDAWNLPPLLTLIAFSAVSLFLGYMYSSLVVFRETA